MLGVDNHKVKPGITDYFDQRRLSQQGEGSIHRLAFIHRLFDRIDRILRYSLHFVVSPFRLWAGLRSGLQQRQQIGRMVYDPLRPMLLQFLNWSEPPGNPDCHHSGRVGRTHIGRRIAQI